MSAETNAPKSRIERLRELLAEAKAKKAEETKMQQGQPTPQGRAATAVTAQARNHPTGKPWFPRLTPEEQWAILCTGLWGLLTMLVVRAGARYNMTPHTWSKKRSLWLRITEPDRTSGCLYHLRELAARLVVVLIFAVYLSLTVCVALLIWRLLSALGL